MDLVSGKPYWPIKDGLPAAYPALRDDLACDVAVIGGGVTGAQVAFLLVEAGVSTVVVDRRDVAMGSTSACTALLAYEPDLSLTALARRIGEAAAMRAYRLCRDAVDRIADLVRAIEDPCGFTWRESLQLASRPAHVHGLECECDLRRRAGLDVEFWTRKRIAAESSLPHRAAILSRDAAQIDPYRFTHALLAAGTRLGLRVFDRTEVTSRRRGRRGGLTLLTAAGARVRADKVVLAAGYEAEHILPHPLCSLHSTYALITEPMEAFPGWPGDRLIWETARPYLYLRQTPDGRAIIGGYDEPFLDARRRDTLLPAKAASLLRRLRQFFPEMQADTAYAWTGTFAESADSLPLVGCAPGHPDLYVALGYGGNGVLFSMIAATIIRDLHLGRRNIDEALFRFER